MSLCSIYVNRDKIKFYYDDINTKEYANNFDLLSDIISKCAIAQFEMKRDYLNKNMVNKRKLKNNLTGHELLDNLFQHIYMHNHIALEDELYEVEDALVKVTKAIKDNDAEKEKMARLLVLEEYIDAYHFITELTSTVEEHYILELAARNDESLSIDGLKIKEKPDITTENLMYLFTGREGIFDNVRELVNLEGPHIARSIVESADAIIVPNGFTLNDNDNVLSDILRCNRDIIRITNFKDWKEYPTDYFSPKKFGDIILLNRIEYGKIIGAIINNIKVLADLIEIPYNGDNGSMATETGLKLLYATYMSKHDENINRQKNDPRYKLKNTGEVVGVEVK